MKKIPGWLIGMLAVVGVGGFVAFTQSGTTALYNKEEPQATETVVETVDCMHVVKDEDACKAAEAVIKRKALEAESAQIGEQIQLLDAQRAELKAKQVELDKSIGTYWSAPATIEALIRKTWPDDSMTALAVARAESGFNPRATNAKDKHKTCYGSYGIFQVGCVHGHSTEVLYDVEANIKIARALYDDAKARTGNGWAPWGAHSNGSYLAYMP